MQIQKGLIGLIVILQAVLFLSHFLVYETWTFSPAGSDIPGMSWFRLVLAFLSVDFVAASLLAFRYTGAAVRVFYRIAAVWLGFLTFLFFAAVFAWILFAVTRLAGLDVSFHRMVEWLFGAAVLAGFYGVFNARWTRITRTTVRLENLPPAWLGRECVYYQRPAPGACAKRQFSATDGCQDSEGRAGRDFYCRRFV